jgi:hypothetical protein
MNEVQVRQTIESMYITKLDILSDIEKLKDIDKKIEGSFKQYNWYEPYRIEWRFENYFDNREEKYVDMVLWRYLVRLYQLEKYMLVTEYKKMEKEINEYRTPRFTPENAYTWLDGLKGLIYENVKLMCKRVYDQLISGTYRTGNNWNAPRKKRNNNGVDRFFILPTGDYTRIFGYTYQPIPSIVDDLEKVCYLLDGKTIPNDTIITRAKVNQSTEVECPYFKVLFHKNGNTHFKLTDETVTRLNRIGPDGNVIGENIKIKVFEEVE